MNPILGIVAHQETRLYDCFDTPPTDLEALHKLEKECFQDTEHDLEKLVNLLHQSKIDSGLIWKGRLGKSIKTKNRVDRKLLIQNVVFYS